MIADTPTLRPIEGTFAAEALGIGVARPLDAGTLAWIEQAFADHPVLVFREQDLGPRELAAFGRCFGKPKRKKSPRFPLPDSAARALLE